MTEPFDPLDEALQASLHGAQPPEADSLAAKAVFIRRRREQERRRRMLAIAAGSTATLAVTLVALLGPLTGNHRTKAGDQVALLGDDPSESSTPSPTPTASTEPPTDPRVAGRNGGYPVDGNGQTIGNQGGTLTHGPWTGPSSPTASASASAVGGVASSGPGQTTSPQPEPTMSSGCAAASSAGPGDSGKCYVIHVGDAFSVSVGDGSGYQWTAPDTDDPKVLERTGVSANPDTTHQSASFVGRSVGTAHVTSTGDMPCRNSTPPCMTPSMLYSVTVNVIA